MPAMIEKSDIALKEWAVLCKALEEGRQTLLIRKGGIAEKKGDFEVEHREFFFFPTYFHQKPDDLVESARADVAALEKSAPPESEIHVRLFATVEDALFVPKQESVGRLAGLHLYSDSCLDMRFHYRNKPGLWVLVLRTYKLPRETLVPNAKEYAGCISWVGLDAPLSTAGARPVLSDAEFEKQREKIREALG